LNKNAFGDRAPPGPAGGAIAPPDLLAVIRGRERERERRVRKGLGRGRTGREGKNVKG